MIYAKCIRPALGVSKSVFSTHYVCLLCCAFPDTKRKKSACFGYLLFEYAINEAYQCFRWGLPGNGRWDRDSCAEGLLENNACQRVREARQRLTGPHGKFKWAYWGQRAGSLFCSIPHLPRRGDLRSFLQASPWEDSVVSSQYFRHLEVWGFPNWKGFWAESNRLNICMPPFRPQIHMLNPYSPHDST